MQRKLYLRSRSLTLAQRALLYAHDELDMSMMRMQLRASGETVKPHEQHFRLQPFEVPLKNRVGPQPSNFPPPSPSASVSPPPLHPPPHPGWHAFIRLLCVSHLNPNDNSWSGHSWCNSQNVSRLSERLSGQWCIKQVD